MTVLSIPVGEEDKPGVEEPLKAQPEPLEEYVDDEWTVEDDMLKDIKTACGIGFPLMLSGMLKMFTGLFTSVMVGRKATILLASTSAAMVWTEPIDEFTRAFGLQVGALGSQAIGAGNFALTGVWCQMSLILVIFVSIPTMFVRMATGPLLEFLGVSPHLAEPAGYFATMTSYTTIIELWCICIWGFVIARGVNTPDMIVSTSFIFIFTAILYYLINVYEIELFGIAVLVSVRRISHLVCLVALTKYMGFFDKAHWRAPSVKELFQKHRWVILMSQAIPAAFDMAFQKANGAVTVALAARLGEAESAAFDVLTQMMFVIFTLAWGISCGFSIILAQRLGAGQPKRAKGVLKAGCVFVYSMLTLISAFLWFVFVPFGTWVSHDPIVQENVISVRGMVCSSVLLSGGAYLMNECLVKQGRVQVIFWTVPPILWLVGSPISILLAPSMGIPGIYWGNLASSTAAFLALCVHVWRSDWESISMQVRIRAEVDPIARKKAS